MEEALMASLGLSSEISGSRLASHLLALEAVCQMHPL